MKDKTVAFRKLIRHHETTRVNTGGFIDFGDGKKWKITSIQSVKNKPDDAMFCIEIVGRCKEVIE